MNFLSHLSLKILFYTFEFGKGIFVALRVFFSRRFSCLIGSWLFFLYLDFCWTTQAICFEATKIALYARKSNVSLTGSTRWIFTILAVWNDSRESWHQVYWVAACLISRYAFRAPGSTFEIRCLLVLWLVIRGCL